MAPLLIVIWCVCMALVLVSIAVVWGVMYPTLRRHGIDPTAEGWRGAGDWKWIRKYRDLCVQHGLSLRYWKMVQWSFASGAALCVLFFVLVVLRFWRALT